ncbi:ESX secretion-associated protein EspG (plasmid) [Mycolicibacterium aichiense]|uniref:ESX secretion-associated protein EspG n=1 Tax=Mycolicibacterium aichiense TaxID=1799 RepID=UPI003D6651FF
MLTTSTDCVWVLQALLGVERMPTALRLKPFIPSAHGDLVVETTQGRQPLQATAQYHDLVRVGVVDERGRVDDVVRDWMTVLSRAEREVMLTIRRPHQPATDDAPATVHERVLVVSRYQQYLAMAARDGDEMVIGGVGESTDPARQIDAICATLIPALGDHPPADIDGINLPKDLIQREMEAAAGSPEGIQAALRRFGLSPWEVEVVQAATKRDDSAMGVVAVIDNGAQFHVHPRVLSVADTEYGRISFTTTAGADGTEWLSIWPATRVSLRRDLGDLLAVPQLI